MTTHTKQPNEPMPLIDKKSVKSLSIGDITSLLRPQQWVKNVVVFAAPAASLALTSMHSLVQTLIAFSSFCLAASSVYAINDTIDRHADAKHPTKRNRPVARGAINPAGAIVLAVTLLTIALALPLLAGNGRVAGIIAIYFLTMTGYSLMLKEYVILDVIILATGFVMRALAGAAAVDKPASEWLIACVFTLCLFFGFGKRRCEIAVLGDAETAGEHRKTLLRYTSELLSHLMNVSAAIAIVTFLLYTLDTTHSLALFPKENLFYTLPIVVYGVFRFAMLTQLGVHSGPTEIILKDKMMIGSIVVWGIAALLIAYQRQLMTWLDMGS